MSYELSVNSQLNFAKNGTSAATQYSAAITVTGNNYLKQTQEFTANLSGGNKVGAAIDLGNVTQLGALIKIKNLSSTKILYIGTGTSTFVPFIELPPGEFAIFRVGFASGTAAITAATEDDTNITAEITAIDL